MLISKSYREQNKLLHEKRPDYGAGGHRWADMAAFLAEKANVCAVLDYGAGKQGLADSLPEMIVHGYDPAIPGIDTPPEPHAVVACCDVLEHIEPECIDDVLDDLARLTKKYVFLVINLQPAKKTLPDGRNAHLIQQPIDWWMPKLLQRWRLIDARAGEDFHGGEGGLMFVGGIKP